MVHTWQELHSIKPYDFFSFCLERHFLSSPKQPLLSRGWCICCSSLSGCSSDGNIIFDMDHWKCPVGIAGTCVSREGHSAPYHGQSRIAEVTLGTTLICLQFILMLLQQGSWCRLPRLSYSQAMVSRLILAGLCSFLPSLLWQDPILLTFRTWSRTHCFHLAYPSK